MMEFYIIGQTIRCSTPAIASQSLKYLEARFYFSGDSWDGHSKWAHFRQGETVFDFALDENDEITADKELNLTLGEWEVYVTGLDENDSRITTTVFIISVVQSGLIDEPLHPIPASVAEQIDVKASTALLMATAVKEMADAGEFDGDSFKVLGFFDTEAELESTITEPGPGDSYGVKNGSNYDVYTFDGLNGNWKNQGPLTGTPGEDGEKGATFTPAVDGNGNLSWTNDGGLANPQPVNIRGPQGTQGPAGEDGKSPYEIAKANGYTGTEATFNAAMTAFPYHHSRHEAGGADPILISASNIKNGAVTGVKVPAKAITRSHLADDARKVEEEDFQENTIPGTALKDGTIPTAKYKENSVTPEKLDRPYLSLGRRIAIASGDDLNNYTTVGCYGSGDYTITNSLANCPVRGYVFGLDVAKTYGGTTTERPESGAYYIRQVLKLTNGVVWRRGGSQTGSTLTWSDWDYDLRGANICAPVIRLNSSTPNHAIIESDAGAMITTSTTNTTYTVSLSAESEAEIPDGFEISVVMYYGTAIQIMTPSGVYFLNEEIGTSSNAGKTYSITQRGSTVVLKKMFTLSGVSYWLIIGRVEVVS